jgi:hypothetical protein
MGTRPPIEARPSLAAQSELRDDRNNAEVEAIYFAPLRELVFRAKTIHRPYGAQTEVCETTAEPVQTCRLISFAAASA